MRLAYSSNAYTRTDLESALRSIAGLGFSAAEILCDHPHLYPGRTPDARIDHLATLLETLELGVSNLNANTANQYFRPLPPENVFEPSLSSADPARRNWRIRYSIEAIRIAARLGAPCISVTSGLPGSGGTPARGMDLFTESLKPVCEAAARHGVRVGIEYEPGLLVERAGEVLETIERVGSPELGVNLDIGHSWLNREPPAETVELLQGRTWNLHLEDIAGHKHYHLVPGEGELPFDRYLAALRTTGYDGFLTVELYTCSDHPEAAGRAARDYLEPLLRPETPSHD
ncbi:MAG TPA: sugar phosphate isomerase/epimerase [Sedimenticola sp.]|nr:sugar phosphate isomerase/epimerase [Sedimenticola sp.]